MAQTILNTFTDYLNITPQMLKESALDPQKRLIVSGILQTADAKNANDRIYSRAILEREAVEFQKKIDEGTNGGELDHPDSPIVELKTVSHKVNKIWWDGDNLMGEVTILNTPMGQIAKEIVSAGMKLGISSRGMGSVSRTDEALMVNEDFSLVTWDLVSQPSTHHAFMHPISEGYVPSLNKVDQKYKAINDIVANILSFGE